MLQINLDEELLTKIVAEATRRVLAEAPKTDVSWREKIWQAPEEMRLGTKEVSEALNRPEAFVYRVRRAKRLKARKLDGTLQFRAGDVREFIKQNEVAA